MLSTPFWEFLKATLHRISRRRVFDYFLLPFGSFMKTRKNTLLGREGSTFYSLLGVSETAEATPR